MKKKWKRFNLPIPKTCFGLQSPHTVMLLLLLILLLQFEKSRNYSQNKFRFFLNERSSVCFCNFLLVAHTLIHMNKYTYKQTLYVTNKTNLIKSLHIAHTGSGISETQIFAVVVLMKNFIYFDFTLLNSLDWIVLLLLQLLAVFLRFRFCLFLLDDDLCAIYLDFFKHWKTESVNR